MIKEFVMIKKYLDIKKYPKQTLKSKFHLKQHRILQVSHKKIHLWSENIIRLKMGVRNYYARNFSHHKIWFLFLKKWNEEVEAPKKEKFLYLICFISIPKVRR